MRASLLSICILAIFTQQLVQQTDANPVGTCPPRNGNFVDFLTHDSDCSKFYKCNWGTPVEFDCPTGLHFNPVLNVCDWPANAGCAGSSSTPTPTTATPTTTTAGTTAGTTTGTTTGTTQDPGTCSNSRCPPINGAHPVYFPHADCGKFCQCDWGVAHQMTCPPGLHFNPTLNVCDWPANAGCVGSSSTPTPTTAAPTPTTPGTTAGTTPNPGTCPDDPCPAINGIYPVYFPHTDCDKFCQCDWGVAYEMICPNDLHFNPVLNVCDWPAVAGCVM